MLLFAVPHIVVIDIVPLVTPDGTVAEIVLSLFTVKAALTPLNRTLLALENPEPLIVTVKPVPITVGLKEVIAGSGFTVIEIEFDVAGLPFTQVAFDVITPVIASLLIKALSE